MAYVVLLSEQSKVELAAIKKSGDKATIKKIANMLLELQEHPRTGTGQVEHLKHFVFEETWSRRINKQYRMIYEIHDLEVYVSVVSLRSHYSDKRCHHPIPFSGLNVNSIFILFKPHTKNFPRLDMNLGKIYDHQNRPRDPSGKFMIREPSP